MTPVLLLTGYLGSGKTTLINHILKNEEGYRFAVIVNDIGAVNIDAKLIAKSGVVGNEDNSLVALQNGCICCTLQTDLIQQIYELMKAQRFDYILIEASGICDPAPIAKTICNIPNLGEAFTQYATPRLDNIVTIVDARRMADEFGCGERLTSQQIGEDDIENLLIQQIEFCSMVLLNKVADVSADELVRIKTIIRALQPQAEIITCNYADVNLKLLIDTQRFNYTQVATSAGWINEINKRPDHHHNGDEHCQHHTHSCHCHHHHNENGETESYGISSFVYYRRQPFDMNKFDFIVMSRWPKEVIRAKGICYFKDEMDMSYLFEQAGLQKHISKSGKWYATLSNQEIIRVMQQEPELMKDWDRTYGDRMQKIVFIGQHMNQEAIEKMLDACLDA